MTDPKIDPMVANPMADLMANHMTDPLTDPMTGRNTEIMKGLVPNFPAVPKCLGKCQSNPLFRNRLWKSLRVNAAW